MEASLTPILFLGVGFGVGFLVAWLAHLLWRVRHLARIRRDAIDRSKAVTAGRVYEQIVPLLPDFPYLPQDARFLGSPVDLVVFDGLTAGDVKRVVFVEVKTGGARLSEREQSVRDAVATKRVEWREIRMQSG